MTGYGMAPWTPGLPPCPSPMDNLIIYRAMSVLYGVIDDPILPPDQARDVIAWNDANNRRNNE